MTGLTDFDAASNPSKKQKKVINDTVEWKITFDQTQGIRTLVDVVGNILNRVNFRIVYDQKKILTFCALIASILSMFA